MSKVTSGLAKYVTARNARVEQILGQIDIELTEGRYLTDALSRNKEELVKAVNKISETDSSTGVLVVGNVLD